MSILLRREWGRDKPPVGSEVDWGHPRSQGLVGCWLFNEGGGGTAFDLTRLNDGTLTSSPTRQIALFGSGLYFNGNYVNCSNFVIPSSAGPVTFSLWIKVVSNTAGSIFGVGLDNNNRCQLHLPYADGTVYWDYGNIGGNFRVTTSYPYTGQWAHVVVTSAGTGGAFQGIYFNGLLASSASVSGGSAVTLTGLTLGTWNVVGGANAVVDNISVHNRALTPGEILDAYVRPFAHIWRPGVRRWFVGAGAAPGGFSAYWAARGARILGGGIT